MEVEGPIRVCSKHSYFRPGARTQQVCSFWLQGRCNRNPCNFLHTEDPSVARLRGSTAGKASEGTRRVRDKPCTFFLRNSCTKGNRCNFLHAFSSTPDISFMTQLTGHENAVKAIALPAGTNRLYTGGQDQTIRIWDCETGQCTGVISMGGDVGCLLAHSGWVFVGLPNEVKALNLQTNVEQGLEGPKGQVHALAVSESEDMLLAGAQDGNILAWKFDCVIKKFQPAAALSGHSSAVITLESADGRLYSGSMDKTIKVWDLRTGHCFQTLQGHTDVVTGLLSWNQFLLSGSLDGTVKVWVASQTGNLELQYTYPEDSASHQSLPGVLRICGFFDHHGKPILLCSLNDKTVRLLELPSFTERGVMFSNDEVGALEVGPGGLVFSGDSGGGVKVWKWAP